MISLAQRVRDFRYTKGWGPDELANRAEISRTALYQIESGKTGLPRAGTLRRIAVALEVSMDDLLGNVDPVVAKANRLSEYASNGARPRETHEWLPSEGGPLNLPGSSAMSMARRQGTSEELQAEDNRFSADPHKMNNQASFDSLLRREGELMSKLHDLLHSPLSGGVAKVVDDLHQLLNKPRTMH